MVYIRDGNIDLSKYSKVTERLSRSRNRDATITWTSVLKSLSRVEIGGSKSVYLLQSDIFLKISLGI